MSSTPSTAHRRDFCRALYLQPSDTKSPHANHPNFMSRPSLTPSDIKRTLHYPLEGLIFVLCDKICLPFVNYFVTLSVAMSFVVNEGLFSMKTNAICQQR